MKVTAISFSAFLTSPLGVCGLQSVASYAREAFANDSTAAILSSTVDRLYRGLAVDQLVHFKDEHLFRKLVMTDACNSTYIEFWNDPTLSFTFSMYLDSWSIALEKATSLSQDVCLVDGNEWTCDTDEILEGEAEFRGACVAAQGEIIAVSLDNLCTMTVEGRLVSLTFDLPSILNCMPASTDFDACVDGQLETLDLLVTDIDSALEAYFISAGFTDVSCVAGDFGGSDIIQETTTPVFTSSPQQVGEVSTQACNSAYNELREDQTLSDTFLIYLDNWSIAANNGASFSEDICVVDGNQLICDADEPLDGEAEFRSACLAAGGNILLVPLDYACTMTLDAEPVSLTMLLPFGLDCVPVTIDFESCIDPWLEKWILAVTNLETSAESSLISAGFTDVSCTVGDFDDTNAIQGTTTPVSTSPPQEVGVVGTTPACNSAYNELWQDQTLSDTYSIYLDSWSIAVDMGRSFSEDRCVIDGNEITCDTDEPLDGEAEFRSACEAVGGEILSIPVDFACKMTSDGEPISLTVDLPIALDCVPATADFENCIDDWREEVWNLSLTDLDASNESSLISAGFTDVSCSVGDFGDPEVVQESNTQFPTPGSNFEDENDVPAAIPGSASSEETSKAVGQRPWIWLVAAIGGFLLA